MYRDNMSNQDMIALWEIAVFLNQQVPATQDAIRAVHKKNQRRAIFLVRQQMEKLGYFQ